MMQLHQTSHPISWFRDRNNEKSLIIKPPYQRKPVWTPRQKTYLIDTILKKYLIPEIYIHRETDAQGNSIYNIVDGQQRIKSILDFISGQLTLSEEYNPEFADFEFSELPVNVKKNLWNYNIFCREITDATEEEVRNLFKRMNLNVVALTPQELRHATYSGEFIRLMEELAENEYWAENKIVSTNEIRRMKDVQFISELFVSMMNGVQDKTKELDNFYAQYEQDFEEKAKWHRFFEKILDQIIVILGDLKNTRWRNKSDFYTLFMSFREILESKTIPQKNVPKLRDALLSFSNQVNESIMIQKEKKKKTFSRDILNYASVVTKATTDKESRILRNTILISVLSKFAVKNP